MPRRFQAPGRRRIAHRGGARLRYASGSETGKRKRPAGPYARSPVRAVQVAMVRIPSRDRRRAARAGSVVERGRRRASRACRERERGDSQADGLRRDRAGVQESRDRAGGAPRRHPRLLSGRHAPASARRKEPPLPTSSRWTASSRRAPFFFRAWRSREPTFARTPRIQTTTEF